MKMLTSVTAIGALPDPADSVTITSAACRDGDMRWLRASCRFVSPTTGEPETREVNAYLATPEEAKRCFWSLQGSWQNQLSTALKPISYRYLRRDTRPGIINAWRSADGAELWGEGVEG